MFIYNLSTNNKYKLPDTSKWLNPNFNGLGTFILNESIINEPKNYKIDFPEFVYDYDNMIQIKHTLNKIKMPMDKINSTPESSRFYYKLTNCFRSYDSLRGDLGILHQEYGAEIVSNAWLKMYENMSILQKLFIKINKSPTKQFNSCHFAEAPGNFLLAINHYLKTHEPKINWNWLASTYRDLYSKKSIYLTDEYGIINKYKENWIYGSDGDGDITSPSNIISFKQDACKIFNDDIHFLTSDVKYAPKNMNYNEEENYNIPVHLGHLLCALTILSQGGVMMLKEFTFYESCTINMLYLMVYCFENVLIVKPETSRAANSEVYIFGLYYKKNLSDDMLKKLLNILGYIRYLNNEHGSPAIFKKEDIPISFIKKVEDLNKKLMENQTKGMTKNLDLYEKYKESNINQICKDLSSSREKLARDWIIKNNVQNLNPSDRLGAVKMIKNTNYLK